MVYKCLTNLCLISVLLRLNAILGWAIFTYINLMLSWNFFNHLLSWGGSWVTLIITC